MPRSSPRWTRGPAPCNSIAPAPATSSLTSAVLAVSWVEAERRAKAPAIDEYAGAVEAGHPDDPAECFDRKQGRLLHRNGLVDVVDVADDPAGSGLALCASGGKCSGQEGARPLDPMEQIPP